MKYSFTLLAVSAAVLASPVPEGVTKAISPSGHAPAGCSPTYPGSFGIAVGYNWGNVIAIANTPAVSPLIQATFDNADIRSVSTLAHHLAERQVVTQISDGQIQAPSTTIVTTSSHTSPTTSTVKSSSSSHTSSSKPASTSSATTSSYKPSTLSSVKSTPSTSSHITSTTLAHPTTSSIKSTSSLSMVTAISQISDGQIQAPHYTSTSHTSAPASTTPSSHAVSSASSSTKHLTSITTSAVITPHSSSSHASSKATSQVSSSRASSSRITVTPVSVISDGQPQAPTSQAQLGASTNNLGACATNGTLTLTLSNGVLKDARGWTGYIADNNQFQFDNPPQSGALYTSGFSVCSNGSLALGGSAVWWECLSGNFYNLYSTWVAPQCTPITLNVVQLVHC